MRTFDERPGIPVFFTYHYNNCIFVDWLFQNCHLGDHVPLEKGIGEEGVIISSSGGVVKQEATPTTDDPNTGTRHGEISKWNITV